MNASLEELRSITHAHHRKKVAKGLLELGIPFKWANGEIVVLRSAIERGLSGVTPDTVSAADIDITARLARANGGLHGKKAPQRRRAA